MSFPLGNFLPTLHDFDVLEFADLYIYIEAFFCLCSYKQSIDDKADCAHILPSKEADLCEEELL